MFEEKQMLVNGINVTFKFSAEKKENFNLIGVYKLKFGDYLEVKLEAEFTFGEKEYKEVVLKNINDDDKLNLMLIKSMIVECKSKVRERIVLLEEEKDSFAIWNNINIDSI